LYEPYVNSAVILGFRTIRRAASVNISANTEGKTMNNYN